MKSFLSLLLIGLSASLFGQITITEDDFPSGGDTAMVSISTDFGLDFASTGEDYEWLFESLTLSEQRIDTFFDVSDASFTYQLVFNNGFFEPDYVSEYYTKLLNFVIPTTDVFEFPIGNPVGFTRVESDAVENVGIGFELGGVELPVKNEMIDVEYEFSMTYGDSWTSESFLEVDLNPLYDGIWRRYQDRSSEVDGWGEITTPFGTFDAVRIRSEIDFTDSLQIPIGETATWIELPTPD